MKKEILNLTQHVATESQREAGVFEPKEKDEIKSLLTFEDVPTFEEMTKRAKYLSVLAITYGIDKVLIGGAPYFMSVLEKELKRHDIQPVYSFSKRISKEVEKDGKVEKINVFEHIEFVEV